MEGQNILHGTRVEREKFHKFNQLIAEAKRTFYLILKVLLNTIYI